MVIDDSEHVFELFERLGGKAFLIQRMEDTEKCLREILSFNGSS